MQSASCLSSISFSYKYNIYTTCSRYKCLVSFKIFIILNYVYVYVCVCTCFEARVIGPVGVGVTDNWKLSNMGVGKCTQVL